MESAVELYELPVVSVGSLSVWTATLQEAELVHCSLLTAHALITVVRVCVNWNKSRFHRSRDRRERGYRVK